MKRIFVFCLALVLCFSCLITPTFANTDYPSVRDFLRENHSDIIDEIDYLVFYQSSGSLAGTYLMVYHDYNNDREYRNAEFICRHINSSFNTYLEFDDNGVTRKAYHTVYYYKLNNGVWTRQTTWAETESTSFDGGVTFYEGTIDVYKNNEIFFQPPPVETTLAEKVMKVVRAEIPATQTNLAQTMKTIVLCGVGCLALLISLALLVKALRRFLQR